MPYPYYVKCDPADDGCGENYPGDLSICPKCGGSTAIISIPADLPANIYVYDIETYPNIFTFRATHPQTGTKYKFEISDRIDQRNELYAFLAHLQTYRSVMVGFNNLAFDYPVIHFIFENMSWISVTEIYEKAMGCIKGNMWDHYIWSSDRYIAQIDLFKIRHFDNSGTGLKDLEFAMRMKNIRDLPYPPGTVLETDEQKDTLMEYNDHDVEATVFHYVRTLSQIKFREKLSLEYDHDFMNHNDTKIGKDYFIMELEKKGVACFEYVNGKKQPIQTIRPTINLNDVIFPYIHFEHPEFKRVHEYFKSQIITATKGVFKDLTAVVGDLKCVFGVGGLHASINSQIVKASRTHTLVDVDVASYYPNLAISNNLYPAHFSSVFCDIYKDVYEQRKQYKKGTPENAMLKLALNGVYGDSNNIYSPFYDPFYTMSITVNGQLLLCMLIEQLIKIPGLKMVQGNTDGVTFLCPVEYMGHQRALCKWWEQMTNLQLEEVLYNRMFIKNVNAYIGEYTDGNLKNKKDYAYDLEWNQDHSALIVPRAAEAALVRGEDIETFVRAHRDPFDFMIRAKVPRSNKLVMRWPEYNVDQPMQRITRYFISDVGGSLMKISPPTGTLGAYKRANKLTDGYFNSVMSEIGAGVWDERIHTKNKSTYAIRETGIDVGWKTKECNDSADFDWSMVNYDYYIQKTKKLMVAEL